VSFTIKFNKKQTSTIHTWQHQTDNNTQQLAINWQTNC